MMLYAFVKDSSGTIFRVGEECSVPAELSEKLMAYTNDGATLGTAEEWDSQVIHGATAGMIADPTLGQSEPAEGEGSTEDGSTANGPTDAQV